ncbi:MAG: U32 family peptidase [Paracoccaceae bacterium]
MTAKLTIGPILFHWPAEQKLDFYARIADEAPVDTVYLGEVVCSKRAPFFEEHYQSVAERLERGGKEVVFSSLAEVMLARERKMMAGFCEDAGFEIEVNDASALFHLSGRAHRLGMFMNVYNEETLTFLAGKGATHVTLPVEMPGQSVAVMAAKAAELGIGCEVMVFGRMPLAISARCYHARAHQRHKDNCQFVCEQDPDGMPLTTLNDEQFLSVNGIQTLSHTYFDLLGEADAMQAMGITDYRLSPHTQDMIAVASIWRDRLDAGVDAGEASARLAALGVPAPLANGFWHHAAGVARVASE